MGNKVCICREILIILGRHYSWMDLNDQIWPSIQAKGISWGQMIEALKKVLTKRLATEDKRQVEGYRLALFYRLTDFGKKILKEIRQGGGINDGAIFGENCCCVSRAA